MSHEMGDVARQMWIREQRTGFWERYNWLPTDEEMAYEDEAMYGWEE